MPKKQWQYHSDTLTIIVSNHWSWSGLSFEEIEINGEVVKRVKRDIINEIDKKGWKLALTTIYCFQDSESDTKVEIKMGSKWHGLATGCHILVNGELVGGDVYSRLLFF
jgi:hypothetical protein